MSVSPEEMEELRQDLLDEDRECYNHECAMRNDFDYALNAISSKELTDAAQLVYMALNELHNYDWDIDYGELIFKLKE